jgi:maltooligosyltrehalose trehalohydrolase
MTRRFPIGAELHPEGVHFRLWAPKRRTVDVVFDCGDCAPLELQSEPGGYFSGLDRNASHGTRYRFRLDGAGALPDPASRFQPEGPHGPSQVIDPARFAWTDSAWRGISLDGQVIYEMHIGTFTREGTWAAATRELEELANLGVTCIEVMPIADFPGRFGWGYDGVGLFAPIAIYGQPDDFRRFVDGAHAVGIGVILDVVYNHVGADGAYFSQFSDSFFTDRYQCEWGQAINYDGEDAGPVREFVTSNAAYWACEFHLDGLRLDATQQIFDASPRNVMADLTQAMRASAGNRSVIVVAENESQESRLARPVDHGGFGLDGLWNDDFHHSATVAATGHNQAYFSDYLGRPQELISAVKHGYLYQGQRYSWQAKRRGTPALDLGPEQFVTYIQNHDQVANSGRGARLHQMTSPGRFRALTAFLLLAPGTPMLFQGEEFAASSPFLFFADHNPDLRSIVMEGRIQFLTQFPELAQPEMRAYHTDPGDPATFERCKLDFAERRSHAGIYQMHRDLLNLRKSLPNRNAKGSVDGAVLAPEALALRYFASGGNNRLLVLNLGPDLRLDPAPEPLLAPPEARCWSVSWSSEDPVYGGSGTPPVDSPEGWRIPGHAAILLEPVEEKRLWQI